MRLRRVALELVLTTALLPGLAAAQGSVVSLSLINADTDQPIAAFSPLPAGATLDLATLPTRNLNIRANTTGNVASVRFALDANPGYFIDDTVPFALAGGTGGDYAAWTPAVGNHTVTATPYRRTRARGPPGTALTRAFTVIDSGVPVNTPPVVNAGADRAITLPATSTTLIGTATDDNLPSGTLTVAWSLVTGPAAVTFATPTATTTTATFSAAGTYTLRLTATDTALSASDDVVVTVTPAANQPPVVNAGADRAITLPATSTTLIGTATDDNLPSGTLTVAWSLVTGPAAVTFATPTATTTTATFSAAGTYTLRLTATDTALSASDDVVVVVNPTAPTFNAIRINAGGGAYVDSLGQVWAADSFFVGTSSTFGSSGSIAGTVEDPLYLTERYGATFGYAIPVPNGIYSLDLHFAEIYWEAAGQRQFDVFAEGLLVMDDADLYALTGPRTALVSTFTVVVTDGVLNVNFTTSIDNAKISAIQVRQQHDPGDPFLHVVIDGPPWVVDYEGAGAVSVPLRGSGSHTHELGRQLASWTWREGTTTLGTTTNIVTPLSVGSHLVSLTIGDDNTPSRTLTGTATVDVYPIGSVGGAVVRYYPAGSTPLGTLIDALPAQPGFVQVLPTWQVGAAGSAIGGSPFTAGTVVVLTGDVQVPTAATYTFNLQGGTITRLLVGGVPVTGPVVLAAGSHALEVRFAVPSAASLPASVRVQVNGGAAVLLDKTNTSSDHSDLPPFINALSGSSSVSGGGTITLDGLGFFPASQVAVLWGGTPINASSLVVTPGRITVAAPPGTGTVAVRVQTPNGVSNTIDFAYLAGTSPIAFNSQLVATVTAPTQAAWGPDGRLYVATVTGMILAYTFDDAYSVTGVETIAAIAGQSNPNILGIAFNPFDPPTPVKIYISHSLLYGKDGTCFTGPFGYVGQVSILTGPGFVTVQPLVTGLPTSNHDHGVNGLAFDNEGDLLIAVGSSTNAGVTHCNMGGVPESPLSAAVIKARISKPGFNGNVTYVVSTTGQPNNDQMSGPLVDVAAGVDVGVFGAGLRNPFDVVWTTKGRLFATDNGPNSSFGEASTSATTQAPLPDTPDELLAIVDGGYYGHPNRSRGRYDTRQNVYRAPTAPATLGNHMPPLAIVPVSSNGIDEYRATAFGGALRGSLLMQRWDSFLYRAALTADGRAIASVLEVSGGPTGLDAVTGPGGAIIGIDYSDNAVTVSLPLDTTAGVQAFDIFPWRARPDIPSSFVIGGVGFGANTSVTIGGVPATITSVSPTRIRGLIPTKAAPTDELLDVVVQTGGLTSIIPAAFRYVLPRSLGTGSWQTGTAMPSALDEVAGGVVNGVMYLVGGGSANTFAYDLAQRSWVGNLPPRPLPGNHHAAEVVGGKLYLFGGLGAGSEGRVQIFDPATQAWTLGADMPFAGGSVSTAVIGGLVYAAGGVVGSTATASAAAYDPTSNSWAPIASMPVGRHHTAAATDGRRFFIFGGRDGPNAESLGFDDVQIYDPATDTWVNSSAPGSTVAPLPQRRSGMGKAAFLGGEFYVIGGETTAAGSGQVEGNVYNRVDVYDPISNTWRLEALLPTPRHGIFPLAADGKILVAGGGTVAGESHSTVLEVFSR